ncbi:hypothetical protein WBQ88_04455 [Sphingopyxis sp. CCNWLW253]|uniref:hypothetical protein n=1 Tax=unclassified Sphingopyxis TaxID=2614943 RepID=UPI003012C85D
MQSTGEAHAISPRQSRFPAFIAGALAPLVIGAAAILTFLMLAASNNVEFDKFGSLGSLVLFLPGTFIVGAAFAFPISCAHVFLMSWLSRQAPCVDNVFCWSIFGPIFTFPLILLFWDFGGPGNVPVFPLLFLALGLIGGAAAGIKRPRPNSLHTG